MFSVFRRKRPAKVMWEINRGAMLAIVPNPAVAEIVCYAIDGQIFVVAFGGGDAGQVSLRITRKDRDGASIVIHDSRVAAADARALWSWFCDRSIPMPSVLWPPAADAAHRSSRVSLMVFASLALITGGAIGWLAAGGIGVWRDSTSSTAVEGASVAGAAVSRVSPPIGDTPPAVAAPPVSVSPALRGAEGGAAVPVPSLAAVPETGESAASLVALRELRIALQEGREVSPDLFRRLPGDMRQLLIAEGIVPPSLEASAADAAPAVSARLPTGVMLRAERDTHGVPMIPPQLPGTAGIESLPPVGGGDLRGAGDFRAFGLQPFGR